MGYFVWKNHDFTQKNHIFSNCGGRRENFWGNSCEKSRFYAKKSYFFQLRREARKFLGYFVWKITILRQKIIFFQLRREARKFVGYFVWKITILRQRGGGRRVRPPLDPPLYWFTCYLAIYSLTMVSDHSKFTPSMIHISSSVFKWVFIPKIVNN